MSQTISRGYRSRSALYDKPSRTAAPGARFCTRISAFSSNCPRISCARFCLTSKVRLSFRSIAPNKVRRLAEYALVIDTREITDARSLHLDYSRPKIGELSRTERCGDRVLDRHDRDPV